MQVRVEIRLLLLQMVECLGSITFRTRQWSKHDLTLIGRCEVARQVLASCLVYHTQFVPVPARMLSLIQRRIKAYTLGLGCIRATDQRHLVCKPAAAVANLPTKRGGIGHVDVRAHATAMQAKVAVALLHPHRHAFFFFFFGTSELHERNHATNRCPSKGPARESRNLANATLWSDAWLAPPHGLNGRHLAVQPA